MKFKLIILFIACIFIFSSCSHTEKLKQYSSESWSYYGIVIWNNHTYLDSNEKINNVGKQIGTIEYYSDKETDEKNNFSNKYKIGTKLYEIPKVDINESIAIEVTKGSYIKLKINKK